MPPQRIQKPLGHLPPLTSSWGLGYFPSSHKGRYLWLENDLPDEESLLLNAHVTDCSECRERLALMKAAQHVSAAGASR